MEKNLSAAQAARILGVSLPTLYAYVSRGMLHSIEAEGARSKRYAHDEVLRLAARKNDGRRAGRTAEAAIDWGMPVLESRITLIADGVIRYRGRDATRLAAFATLEQTAQILWGHPHADFFGAARAGMMPRWPLELRRQLASQPPLERAMVLLPLLGTHFQSRSAPAEHAFFEEGALLMHLLAAALLDDGPESGSLHSRMASAWRIEGEAEQLLRAALVLCADHELNASTFTVRCVASTGAHLSAALTAGLAALSGPRHGGESLRVRALMDGAPQDGDWQRFLLPRLGQKQGAPRFGKLLPGFGHPLYPDGDPRARMLLALLAGLAESLPAIPPVLALAQAGQEVSGEAPNLDFGLAAIELALGLPRAAAQSLFALGRCAGWIAHAAEQLADGGLIRPRARYVGSFDFDE